MNKEELYKFYEKLYFHEIDSREKINSRLQIVLAIIVGQISIVGYILKSFDKYEFSFIVFLLGVTLVFLGLAIMRFVFSWYNYEYEFLPTAKDTEDYRDTLLDTYKDFDNCDYLVEDALKNYIYNYFIECSTRNTLNNDTRSVNLHKTASNLIISFCLSAITIGILFYNNVNINASESNNTANQVYIYNGSDKLTLDIVPNPFKGGNRNGR